MIELIGLQLVLATVGSYSTKIQLESRFASGVFTRQFTPDTGEGLELRARATITSNFIRAFLLAVIGIVVIWQFNGGQGGISGYLHDPLARALWLVGTAAVVIGLTFFQPRKLAREHGQSSSVVDFKQHRLPYMLAIPYFVMTPVTTAALIVATLVSAVSSDQERLNTVEQSLSPVLTSTVQVEIEEIQKASILLVNYGIETATSAQNFIALAILMLTYLVVEQRTNMQAGMFQASLDRAKVVVWMFIVVAILFGAILLPRSYATLHTAMQEALPTTVLRMSDANKLDFAASVQEHLASHDLTWLAITIATGYRNVLVLVGSLLVRYVLFHNQSLVETLGLLLPSPLFDRTKRVFVQLGLDVEGTQAAEETLGQN